MAKHETKFDHNCNQLATVANLIKMTMRKQKPDLAYLDYLRKRSNTFARHINDEIKTRCADSQTEFGLVTKTTQTNSIDHD